MQDDKSATEKKTAFESTLEITNKEELDRLESAFEESLKGKNVSTKTPEEMDQFLKQSIENFRRRYDAELQSGATR